MKIGICYRPTIHSEYIKEILKEVDILEIMPDIMTVEEIKFIRKIAQRYNKDIGIHSLKSSIASPYGISEVDVEKYYFITSYLDAVYFSDHLAFSHIENKYLSSVFPIEYNDINKKVVSRNLEKLNNIFEEVPVLVENITQYELVNKEKSEGKFFKSVSEKNDILLDITNLYITAKSNGLNPYMYIKEFPLDRVKTLHISGISYDENNLLIDSHSEEINEEILSFLKENLQYFSSAEYILVERDFNINSEQDILKDIESIKRIF